MSIERKENDCNLRPTSNEDENNVLWLIPHFPIIDDWWSTYLHWWRVPSSSPSGHIMTSGKMNCLFFSLIFHFWLCLPENKKWTSFLLGIDNDQMYGHITIDHTNYVRVSECLGKFPFDWIHRWRSYNQQK